MCVTLSMQTISLSIFFPAYNEEQNIIDSVRRTDQLVRSSPFIREYEIIIINDGSTDNTRRVAENLVRRYPHVRLVNHERNKGYGAALQTGMREARMEYVFFTDADLQFDIAELQNLIIHLTSHPVVVGYRAPRRDPFMRLVNAWGWNKLNRLFFGLSIKDIDCAFKVFRRDLVQNLPLQSSGAMISAETLIRLSRQDVPIKEVPVTHLPRKMGSPTGAKPSVIIRAFAEMLRLYRTDLGLGTQKEALKFMSVGVLNTLLDLSAYVFLTRATELFATHLTAAKFFSFLIGTISSLLLNRAWTFGRSGRLTMREVIRFYATVSVSIALNVAVMNFFVGLGMYDLVALLITTLITFASSFTLSKFWVFAGEHAASTTKPNPYGAQ